MNQVEIDSLVENIMKSLKFLNQSGNSTNTTNTSFCGQNSDSDTDSSDSDSDDSDDSDDNMNNNPKPKTYNNVYTNYGPYSKNTGGPGQLSNKQIDEIFEKAFSNFGSKKNNTDNNPFGFDFANAFTGNNFQKGKGTYTVNTFVNGQKVDTSTKTYDSDEVTDESDSEPEVKPIKKTTPVKKVVSKPAKETKTKVTDIKTKPVKDTVKEPDMNETDFDNKIKKTLESQTNIQLKFICGKLQMSRSTYKNKAEYVKMITEHLKSRNDKQIKDICNETQTNYSLPKFKQMVDILEKINN